MGIDYFTCDTEKGQKGSGSNANAGICGPLESPGSFGQRLCPPSETTPRIPMMIIPRGSLGYTPVSRKGFP